MTFCSCRHIVLSLQINYVRAITRRYHTKHLKVSKMYPGITTGTDSERQKVTPVPNTAHSHRDTETACNSLKLMLQNRLIHGGAAGTYTLSPPLTRSMEKLAKIIDQEMQNIGAQKITMPSLATGSMWKKSDRWNLMGSELLRFQDRLGKDLCLAPTHEEAVTSMVGADTNLTHSKLPLKLYQIGRKFRDEMRPKHGLLRGREFEMKDLYTFDIGPHEAESTYNEVCQAYSTIFRRLQLKAIQVEADTGAMGGSTSHEYHLESPIGEDTLLQCSECGKCVNQELADPEALENSTIKCSDQNCTGTCKEIPGIEVAHAFILGTKYSKIFKAKVLDTSLNKSVELSMGCYGIGVTRLLAAAVEVLSTESHLRWPPLLAPHQICIISQQTGHYFEESLAIAESLQKELLSRPNLDNEVVLDDRFKLSIGKRIKQCSQAGFPYLVVVGKKVQEDPPLLEYHDVQAGEVQLWTREQVLDRLSQLSTVPL